MHTPTPHEPLLRATLISLLALRRNVSPRHRRTRGDTLAALLSVLLVAGCGAAAADESSQGTLLSATFESGGFAARGWYDISADLPTASEKRPGGGARVLHWHWTRGATNPDGNSAARHKLSPTDRVYLRYWVKYSPNWVGSGASVHPHEIMLLTTEDDAFVGPAFTHLTAYIEHNWRPGGGVPVVSLQDGRNVDRTRINANLVGVTEQRAAHGCNGLADSYANHVSCYAVNATTQFNGRSFGDPAPVWSDATTAANYKSGWHLVEAYFQLNTVQNGVGKADGVIRYWFDRNVVLDLSNVLFRTGQYPNMMFNQLMLGPFMGDGSPVDQSAWIDDMVVARERIN